MKLCPKCRLDYLTENYIQGECGEEYIEFECWECGYKYLEVNDPYYVGIEEPIEGDDLG